MNNRLKDQSTASFVIWIHLTLNLIYTNTFVRICRTNTVSKQLSTEKHDIFHCSIDHVVLD